MKTQSSRRIATFAPKEIGDTIMATPLYQALRDQYADAHFTLFSETVPHPVLEGLNVFDETILYKPGMEIKTDYNPFVVPAFCGKQKANAQFEKMPSLINLDQLLKKHESGLKNRLDGAYSHLLFYKHQVELNLDVAELAGCRQRDFKPYCPQGDPEKYKKWEGCTGLYINTPVNKPQALPNRQWPLAHWKELVRRIPGKKVLVGGPSDLPNLQKLAEETQTSFCVTAEIKDFTAFCRNLALLIATEGGAVHIAATAEVPIIALYGKESPVLTGPWVSGKGKAISILSPNSCSPCDRSYRLRLTEAGLFPMNCMQNLKPEQVLEAVQQINRIMPGERMIMKRQKCQTAKNYIHSFPRQVSWAAGYNFSRLILRMGGKHFKQKPEYNTYDPNR